MRRIDLNKARDRATRRGCSLTWSYRDGAGWAYRVQAELEPADQYQMSRPIAATIETTLAQADAERRPLAQTDRHTLLMLARSGTCLLRQDGALHREAQMREQVADLAPDTDTQVKELRSALSLLERITHPDADRVRSRLNGVATKTPSE